MLGVKVPKANAEMIKRYLAGHKLMVNNYRLISGDEFIYFPISRADPDAKAFFSQKKCSLVHANFEKAAHQSSYRERLMDELGTEYAQAIKGYDMIGSIAVIESRNVGTAKKIARVILSTNKNARTVIRKVGAVSGVYRKRRYEYVAGERSYEAVYNENGASFRVDVRKSFFSPRLAFERDRIRRLIRKRENVMVMFAGVGPFAIEIAKSRKDSKVVAIELNREAYRYMLKNIELNRLDNVEARAGDVRKIANSYSHFADRIVMPLPKDSFGFLGSVLKVAKSRCIVHYYAFGGKDSAFEENTERLREFFKSHGRRFRVLFKRVVRPYSPKDIEIVVDFVITKQ